jgi:molecular chaperone Hsp33
MRTADAIHRFHLANATVRGHLVRLESVWAMVRDNVDCPSAVGELLGESLVAAALLAGALKFDGRLSIQLRDVGPLKLLFAECSNEGNIRGLARCADDSPQFSPWTWASTAPNWPSPWKTR